MLHKASIHDSRREETWADARFQMKTKSRNLTRALSAALVASLTLAICSSTGSAQSSGTTRIQGNRPDRVEWFRDLGFGMFVHWNVDGTLGGVISHSLVGASDDYFKRYLELLPKAFNPRKYHPEDWAVLAR